MEREIRGIIWDMGGVILRTMDPSPRTELAKHFGLTRKELENVAFLGDDSRIAELGQITREEHWSRVASQFGMSPQDGHIFEDQFWAGDRVDKDLITFISALRSKYKTGLLSNAWSDMRELLNGYMPGCLDVFDASVFSYEVGLVKPDERIFQLILDKLGVQPSQAVFIDDFEINIAGAQAAGLNAIQFKTLEQVKMVLAEQYQVFPG
ncbi:MAG TPA: HAD family phosphatase [Anaerolineaceae bacterium]|nr:HAD family phosphatase [Anaerolineaceae bacterium]